MVNNMISCIEIALKPDLFDAEGASLTRKALDYFNIRLTDVRTVNLVTLEADLTIPELCTIKDEILTNPVTQISSLKPLDIDFDWCIWIGLRPGVRDNPASTAVEAVEDLLNRKFGPDDGIYTSRRYAVKGEGLTREAMEILAGELLSNPIIQQWKVFEKAEWDQIGRASCRERV